MGDFFCTLKTEETSEEEGEISSKWQSCPSNTTLFRSRFFTAEQQTSLSSKEGGVGVGDRVWENCPQNILEPNYSFNAIHRSVPYNESEAWAHRDAEWSTVFSLEQTAAQHIS